MLGGYFDEHPWGTFDAPILVEDAAFPGMKQWPASFTLKDEIYQVKNFSRENTRVLMRLDPGKLDLANPKVHRKDNDFAVSWAKMYGKGRVFYSTLGHVDANWDRPEMQKMYTEAIKWALRLVDADVTPRRLAMMTRRTFTGTLASAFAASRVATAATKLNLGIGTYTYHSLSIDDMIVQLKRLEIRQIEMSRGEFMLFSKPAPEKFQSVKTKLDSAGIQCVSYYTATIKDDKISTTPCALPICWACATSPATRPAIS